MALHGNAEPRLQLHYHRLRIQYQKTIPSKPFDEITHKDKVRFEIYPPVERELTVEPLKVFERNNQTVVLYRVVY